MKRLLWLLVLFVATGCGGDTKPPLPADPPGPEPKLPANPPKGKQVALPQ